MPRRSVRKRVKNSLHDFPEEKTEDKFSAKKREEFASGEKECCCKCGEEDSPINKGEEEDTWINCDLCGKWWHGACAKLSEEDVQNIIRHKIRYPCAFCVIGESSSSKELKKVSDKLDKILLTTCSAPEDSGNLPETDRIIDKHLNPPKFNKDSVEESSVLIVDSLASPEKFRSSIEINKELAAYPTTEKRTERAYSLPLGGIALHLKEQEDCENFIKNWPDTAFGGKTHIHPTKSYSDKKIFVAFAKNIPRHLSEESIKEAICVHGSGLESIHRLRYFKTGKLLPVIKAVFKEKNLYDICLDGIFIPETKSKYTTFEPERKYRVIRCFNCHRFGHISKICVHKARCVNCGSEECSDNNCSVPAHCANCGGAHIASSSKCSVFREISRKRRIYSILQNSQ